MHPSPWPVHLEPLLYFVPQLPVDECFVLARVDKRGAYLFSISLFVHATSLRMHSSALLGHRVKLKFT